MPQKNSTMVKSARKTRVRINSSAKRGPRVTTSFAMPRPSSIKQPPSGDTSQDNSGFEEDDGKQTHVIQHLKMIQQFCETADDSFAKLKALVSADCSEDNYCIFDLALIEEAIHKRKGDIHVASPAAYRLSISSLGLANMRRAYEAEGKSGKIRIDADAFRPWAESW